MLCRCTLDRNRLSIILISVATFIAALFVPLIVKLRLVELLPAFVLNGYPHLILDGFSWYKAVTVIFCGCLATVGLLLHKGPRGVDDGLLGIIALLAILSSLFSPYRALNIWGVPYLFEGLPSSLAYVALAMAAMRLPESIVKRCLPWGISFSLVVVAIFGISEIAGKLLVNDPWLASWLLNTADGISPYSGFQAASFPFGNPNYMGMYSAMVWSFVFALALTRRRLVDGIILSSIAAGGFALLLASMCRGGFIAAGIAVSFALIVVMLRQRPRLINSIALVLLHALAYQVIDHYSASRTVERVSSVPPQFTVESFTPPVIPAVVAPVPVATFSKIYLEQGRLKIEGNGPLGAFTLLLERHYQAVKFMDGSYQPLAFTVGGVKEEDFEKVELQDPRYAGLSMVLHDAGFFRVLTMNGIDVAVTNWGFRIGRVGAFVTPVNGERFSLPFADTAFSQRGYVWAYSIPLLKDTILFGHGAGSFPFEFPNNDFIKMSSMFGVSGLVDKPHNFYISFAHTHGVLALIVLLVLLGRLFWIKGRSLLKGDRIARDLPYFIASIGFLITGISVDSTNGVGAVFWVLLGVGLQKAPSPKEKAPLI